MSEKVNLAENLSSFSDHWSPRTMTECNGHDVMVVKVLGEFIWHKHDDTDDLFLVLQGKIDIQMRDRTITLGPGEMFEYRAPSCRPQRGPCAADRAHRHAKYRRRRNGGDAQARLTNVPTPHRVAPEF